MKIGTTVLELPEGTFEAFDSALRANDHETLAKIFDAIGLQNKNTVMLSHEVSVILAGVLTFAAALADAGRLSDDMAYTLIDYLAPNVVSTGIIGMLLIQYSHEEVPPSNYANISRKLKAAPFVEKTPRDALLDGLPEDRFLDYCHYLYNADFDGNPREIYAPFGITLIRYIYRHKMMPVSTLLCYLQIYMSTPAIDVEIRLFKALYGATVD